MLHSRRCGGRCYPYCTYLHDGCGLHPTPRIHENAHGRSVHDITRRPFHSEGVHRVPLISSMPATRRLVGRWLSSAPASTPCFPSRRILELPGTLTPRRVSIARIPSPVGTRPRPRPRKLGGSLCSFFAKPLGRNSAPSLVGPRLRSYATPVTPPPPAAKKTRFIA